MPNEIDGMWTEGPVKAHIYLNHASISIPLKINNWRHFGNGAAGNVDRALIVAVGMALVDGAFGHADSYKTIAGSIAPFRLTLATGVIHAQNCTGSTVSITNTVEDETGATTTLTSNTRIYAQNEFYGNLKAHAVAGQVAFDMKVPSEAVRWFSAKNYGNKGISLGGGVTDVDTSFVRKDANIGGMDTGDSFMVDGAWNGGRLILGGYHLWVDGTGKLKIKFGAPTGIDDGTIVGVQA
jgi:hypothetical protein